MTHTHFHEITADTPREMGLAMGRAFGAALQPFLQDLKPLTADIRDYLAACFALTRLHFPAYAEELEGYAAGAGTSIDLFWQMMLEDDVHAITAEKCTSMATNNGRLLGHNEDWDAAAAGRLFILHRRLKSHSLFELHYAGTPGGNAVSVNGTGLVQMINSLEGRPIDIKTPRVPTNIIARAMADSADPKATLAKLRNTPRMGGYAHTLIGTSEKILVEMSQDEISVHDIASFPFVHANHYKLDDMQHCNRRTGMRAESSRQRYDAAASAIKPQMNSDEVKTLLHDNSRGPDNSLLNQRTIAGTVIDLEAKAIHIRLLSEPEKSWVEYKLL